MNPFGNTLKVLFPTSAILLLHFGCGGKSVDAPPPAPVAPSITTQPQSQTVLEGSTATFSVVVSGTTPLTYQWKKGGTDISGATSASYTTAASTLADSGGVFTVTATNSVGSITSSPATLTVHPNPTISSFTATPTTLTAGGTATLAFAFAGGTGSIDNAVGAVTSGTNVSVSPTATTTYTLTVDNGFGTKKTGTAVVTVVPAPVTPVITAPSTVTTGKTGLTASVAAQAGMSYLWTITGGTITAGGTTNQITFTAGATGTVSLGCTATNAAGASAAAVNKSVSVVAAPVATSLVPSTATPLYGATVTLTPTFTNATSATITPSITSTAVSGTAYTTPAITASTTYTLTATNAANDVATATTTVTPQAVAVGVTPATANVSVNGTANFVANVTGAANSAVTWSASSGSVDANGVFTAPATAGTVTVTATSVADTSKKGTATVTVFGVPTTPVIAVPTTVGTGQTGITASVPTQPGMTYTWAITNGTITAGAGTNQITFTAGTAGSLTLSCTLTNPLGATATGNATVTVSAAVNHPPVFTTTPPTTVHTQQTYSYTIGTSDPDGDAVTLSFVSMTGSYGGSSVPVYSPNPVLTGNTLTWTPWVLDSEDTCTITVRATDAKGATTDQTWSLTLNASTYGSLTQGNAMPGVRDQHTVTQLGDGRILIVGGNNTTSSSLNTALLYDPSTKLYTAAGNLATPRTEHMAVFYGGKVWVFGGYAGSNPTSVERWNRNLNAGAGGFETCGALKRSRYKFTITPLATAGQYLIVGGSDIQTQAPVAEIELYDMTANGGLGSSTVVGNLITPRWGHTTVKSGTKLFVFGGGSSTNNGIPSAYATTTEVIDLANNYAVTSQAGLTTPRVYAQYFNLPKGDGSRVYLIFGGATGPDGNNAQTLSSSESFDPSTGLILGAGPSLVKPRVGFARAGLFDGKTALIAGGGIFTMVNGTVTSDTGHDTIETWDATANAGAGGFVLLPAKFSTPRTRIDLQTCVSNVTGEFMVFGGNTAGPSSDLFTGDLALYAPINPTTSTFTSTPNLVSPTKGGQLTPVGDGLTLLTDQTNAQTQIYNLATNAWTAGPLLQDKHEAGVSLELPGNNVAIFSGASSWAANPVVTTKVEWVWRNADGTFSTTFAATSVLNYGRVGLTATAIPGTKKALVVGGMNGSQLSVPQIELYDAAANSNNGGSTVIGSGLSTAVAYHKALYANGKVYIVGGVKDPGQSTPVVPAKVQIVDPTTGAVTLGASMPGSGVFMQGIQLRDGRLLLAGSFAFSGAVDGACYLFDPSANGGLGSFTATGAMVTARTNAAFSLLADGRVLMTGGRTVFDGTKPGVATAEVFNPTTGTWSAVTNVMSATRAEHVSCSQKDGSVLIVGNGIDQQGPTAQGAYGELFK